MEVHVVLGSEGLAHAYHRRMARRSLRAILHPARRPIARSPDRPQRLDQQHGHLIVQT